MGNPFLKLPPVQLGPDGQAYYCSPGAAALGEPVGELKIHLEGNPNAPLTVPASGVITQLALYLPQPLRLGIPGAILTLMRSRQQRRRDPSVTVRADDSGYIPDGFHVCPDLLPGAGVQVNRDESFAVVAGATLGEGSGNPQVGGAQKAAAFISTSDDSPGWLYAAVWYSIPFPIFEL